MMLCKNFTCQLTSLLQHTRVHRITQQAPLLSSHARPYSEPFLTHNGELYS